jgi:hypothetical protein
MPEKRRCNRCGKLLPADAIDNTCPFCMVRAELEQVLKGRDPDVGRDLAVKGLLDSHEGKPELVPCRRGGPCPPQAVRLTSMTAAVWRRRRTQAIANIPRSPNRDRGRGNSPRARPAHSLPGRRIRPVRRVVPCPTGSPATERGRRTGASPQYHVQKSRV